jgi:hypothetical protein
MALYVYNWTKNVMDKMVGFNKIRVEVGLSIVFLALELFVYKNR